MNDSALDYQRLLTDAIHKQMIILGTQITLTKARNVPGLTITNDGNVTGISPNPQNDVTLFLEQFRDISSPLVKKTMQPLLSAVTAAPTPPPQEKYENDNQKIT